jgi:ABC-type amino acid transport substrate-binding protein
MNRKFSLVLSIVALILLAGLLLSSCQDTPVQQTDQSQETVYSRVIKAGKIRCVYVVYPPGAIKDPNTGKLSGIAVETIEEVGKNLGLKIEWTEEVGWGTMIEGLETNRYDLVVSGIWPNASRAKLVSFSEPLYYSGIGVYVRQNDSRFSGDLGAFNSENIKIATIDGEMSDIIARGQFPRAQRVSLPQLSDVSQVLLNIAQGRADVTFVEPYIGNQFLQNNPGSVKNLVPQKPIRIFGNTVMFRRGQPEFESMLNTAMVELINSGFVDGLVDKYETFPGALFRRSLPYRTSGPDQSGK